MVAPEEESLHTREVEAFSPMMDPTHNVEDALCEAVELRSVMRDMCDIFRVRLGRDPPVDMPPLEVTFIPDAVSVRYSSHRYSPTHSKFLREHVG
ncbi:hypothetical protein PsorP6_014747 [Peronosclerospora sorghi]|uniref:Uncharacterized protein n=1 Tax=Peronosclerospora sorghi TaxID=230839 RepID=A0ACC0VSX6_9STRA|nr:hypothetical protein PsorP6_014747 [Peronosclerospora sorghi]